MEYNSDINRLYTALTVSCTDSTLASLKKTGGCIASTEAQDFISKLMADIPAASRRLYAAALCSFSMLSTQRETVTKLDPVNTYDIPLSVTGYTLYDIIPDSAHMTLLMSFIDEDLRRNSQLANFTEFAGGVAVHILRRLS